MASNEDRLAARIEVMHELIAGLEREVDSLQTELSLRNGLYETLSANADALASEIVEVKDREAPLKAGLTTLHDAISTHWTEKNPGMSTIQVEKSSMGDPHDVALYKVQLQVQEALLKYKGIKLMNVTTIKKDMA
ncbi:MAG: hypothetical protein JWR61_5800 [Ferruginibacter sp.]|uniref:hypothetical protein n=1 Tax=Ferruginibacter sp. TaxID=1940288 RepID=UPI00265AB0C4|nr:hypothetical protein [Ferruginibacter sp.]MDB5280845.1 hypothetical protein [Ferruginibacter sp.]